MEHSRAGKPLKARLARRRLGQATLLLLAPLRRLTARQPALKQPLTFHLFFPLSTHLFSRFSGHFHLSRPLSSHFCSRFSGHCTCAGGREAHTSWGQARQHASTPARLPSPSAVPPAPCAPTAGCGTLHARTFQRSLPSSRHLPPCFSGHCSGGQRGEQARRHLSCWDERPRETSGWKVCAEPACVPCSARLPLSSGPAPLTFHLAFSYSRHLPLPLCLSCCMRQGGRAGRGRGRGRGGRPGAPHTTETARQHGVRAGLAWPHDMGRAAAQASAPSSCHRACCSDGPGGRTAACARAPACTRACTARAQEDGAGETEGCERACSPASSQHFRRSHRRRAPSRPHLTAPVALFALALVVALPAARPHLLAARRPAHAVLPVQNPGGVEAGGAAGRVIERAVEAALLWEVEAARAGWRLLRNALHARPGGARAAEGGHGVKRCAGRLRKGSSARTLRPSWLSASRQRTHHPV